MCRYYNVHLIESLPFMKTRFDFSKSQTLWKLILNAVKERHVSRTDCRAHHDRGGVHRGPTGCRRRRTVPRLQIFEIPFPIGVRGTEIVPYAALQAFHVRSADEFAKIVRMVSHHSGRFLRTSKGSSRIHAPSAVQSADEFPPKVRTTSVPVRSTPSDRARSAIKGHHGS